MAAHYDEYAGASAPYESNLEPQFKSPNTIVNQESDDNYVRISIKIPGLKVKRQINLSKVPKNGRLVGVEYRKNMVSLTFVLNEGLESQVTYRYTSKEPLKGTIQEEKSTIKYDENTIHWNIHKSHKW